MIRFLLMAFTAGVIAGWLGHWKWQRADSADAWEARASSIVKAWEDSNDRLGAALDKRDTRVSAFHARDKELDATLNRILEEVRDAPIAHCAAWGDDGSVRLNKGFRTLDATRFAPE